MFQDSNFFRHLLRMRARAYVYTLSGKKTSKVGTSYLFTNIVLSPLAYSLLGLYLNGGGVGLVKTYIEYIEYIEYIDRSEKHKVLDWPVRYPPF